MFARLVRESFVRNPRRKVLTAAALVVGMAVATATLTVALEVGDRLAREFRTLGANLIVTPESDTLPLEIGGVDYRPVDEGAYLPKPISANSKRFSGGTIFSALRRFSMFRTARATGIAHDDGRHVVRARSARAGRHDFRNGTESHASIVADTGPVVP